MKLSMSIWMATMVTVGSAVLTSAEEAPVLKTKEQKTGYVIGVDMARNLKRQGIEVDQESMVKGLKDGLSGDKLLISEGDFRQTLVEIQTGVRQKHALTRGRPLAAVSKKRGELFLAENKTKPGVVALPSGLQYSILKTGNGKTPTATDTVECYYRGTLLDGTQFVCTSPGQPATFKVQDAAVPGWKEVLPLMTVGSKWRLFIPPQLAYGVEGAGHDVGPNETVIFEVELMGIK